jgi:predicted TPR repeat methyltransferase
MEPTESNRRAWNQLHRRGAQARVGLPAIVRQTLGDLTRKRVLHLHCRSGEGAAELAELGAVVTAIDASAEALEAARERWPSILWVQGEVQALPAELRRRRYDLVFSPEGTLARLADLEGWARGVAGALAARGELLMYEEHPVAECVDGLLRWQHDYFDESVFEQRLWRLGRVVTAVAGAGLRIEALEEYPGDTAWRRHDRRVPGSFLLYARKPQA